jgi:hypothetical protein
MLDARTIRIKQEGDFSRLAIQIRQIGKARTLPTQLAAYLEAIRLAERIKQSAWVLGEQGPGITEEENWEIPRKLKDKLKDGGRSD